MEKKNVVLFLGPNDSLIYHWLKEKEETVIQKDNKIEPNFIDDNGVTFLISYGYCHILKKSILDKLINKAINLHISYLPWNRGADPNFWSFIDDTPKGVTIHHIDTGVDTGDIIVQKEIFFPGIKNETLATTYEKLNLEIQNLFKENWSYIKNSTVPKIKQKRKGSYHKKKDKEHLSHILVDGWNTSISHLVVEGRRYNR